MSADVVLRRLVPASVRRILVGSEGLLVVRSSLAGVTIRVLGVLLMTVVTVLFTRLMGAEDYGRLAFLLSGSFIIVLFAGLGIPTASSRLLPRYLARNDHGTAAHYLVAGLALLTVTATVAAAALSAFTAALPSVFADYRFAPLGVVGLIVTISLMRFVSEASRAVGLNLTGFIAESIAVRALLLVLLALFIATGARLSADQALILYVLAQAAVVAGVIGLMVRAVRPDRSAFRLRPRGLYRRWLGISSSMLVTPVFYFLLFETDVLVLGILAGPYDVGLYQVARRLAELSVFCAGAASAIGMPRLARAHAERRPDQLQATVDVMNLIALPSTALVAVALVAVGPFGLWLFGPEFEAGFPALLVLAFGRVLLVCFGPASDILLMTGHHRRLARVNGFFAAANLILNLILVPAFGSLGAAVATSTTAVCWNAWLYLLVRRHTPVETSVIRRFWLQRGATAAPHLPG